MMMEEKNKVTIIVPVYNVEAYLERCVNSLTHQTMPEIEILLIDDGSTDQSGRLCDELAQTDSRIHVYHKENEGQGIARNLGLQKATGTYICFLDSDDYYDLETCRELYQLMEKTQADMCCFGYQIETQKHEVVRVPNILEKEYVGETLQKEFTLHYFGDQPGEDNLRGFSSCMTIFRRSIITQNQILFPSEREYLSEDTIFSLRFCKCAKKAVTTSKIYYHYCQNSASFSQAFHAERLDQTIAFAKALDRWAQKLNIEAETQIRRAMYVWVNLMAYLKQGIRYYDKNEKKMGILFVRESCGRTEIQERLLTLEDVALPKQQKILLYLILNKRCHGVVLLIRIRARKKL